VVKTSSLFQKESEVEEEKKKNYKGNIINEEDEH